MLRALSISVRKPLSSSSSVCYDECQVRSDCRIKSPLPLDHKLWWKENEDIVRHLLEGGNGSGDCEVFDDANNSSSSSIFFENCFERAYASDAIYQDLFIDTPPCRDTVKLSFELINRYWEIEVTEWGPPTLMTTISNHTKKDDDKYNDNTSEDHQTSNHFANNLNIEAVTVKTLTGGPIFLRVPYAVAQRPRFFFLSSTLFKKSLLLPVPLRNFFDYKYEGWIDLYLRPASDPSVASNSSYGSDSETVDIINNINNSSIKYKDDNDSEDCKNSNWEVYRHDDRIRAFPPKLIRYYTGIDERGCDFIDTLSIIGRLPLISNIFQRFRRGHGKVVQYVATKRN